MLLRWVKSLFKPTDIRADFEERFPGRCVECSLHAFGIRMGHFEPGTVPADHRCPERWDRWKGALHRRS